MRASGGYLGDRKGCCQNCGDGRFPLQGEICSHWGLPCIGVYPYGPLGYIGITRRLLKRKFAKLPQEAHRGKDASPHLAVSKNFPYKVLDRDVLNPSYPHIYPGSQNAPCCKKPSFLQV